MNAKLNLLLCVLCLLGGFITGFSVYSTFLCVDTNKAIVNQMGKDAEKVKVDKDKAEIR